MKKKILWIVVLLAIDLGLKQLFSNYYQLNEVRVWIPSILSIGYIRNYGAAFGIFQNGGFILLVVGIVAVFIMFYILFNKSIKKRKIDYVVIVLLISGALGNVIDRIIFGYVIDFIQVPFLPVVGKTVFNTADIWLNMGIVLYLFDTIRDVFSKRKKA